MKPGGAIRFEAYDELSYCTRGKKKCMQRKRNGEYDSRGCSQLLVTRAIVAGPHNTAVLLR